MGRIFDQLGPWVANLQNLLWRRDEHAILEHLKILVPEYQPYIEASGPVGQLEQLNPAAVLQRAIKAVS